MTRAYIERRGRLALSRALNIGRVVGFVASGATSGYGHPSWKGFVEKAVETALELVDQTPRNRDGATRAAKAALTRMQEQGGLDKKATQALGLAESLARLVGMQDEFREKLATMFSRNRNVLRDPENKRTKT